MTVAVGAKFKELRDAVNFLVATDEAKIFHNRNGSRIPTSDDDLDAGYSIGSKWFFGIELYVCTDNTNAASVWIPIASTIANITGGTISGLGTPLPVASGGTGTATLSAFKDSLNFVEPNSVDYVSTATESLTLTHPASANTHYHFGGNKDLSVTMISAATFKPGEKIRFHKVATDGKTISFVSGGYNIEVEGVDIGDWSTFNLTENGDFLDIVSDGTKWYLLEHYQVPRNRITSTLNLTITNGVSEPTQFGSMSQAFTWLNTQEIVEREGGEVIITIIDNYSAGEAELVNLNHPQGHLISITTSNGVSAGGATRGYLLTDGHSIREVTNVIIDSAVATDAAFEVRGVGGSITLTGVESASYVNMYGLKAQDGAIIHATGFLYSDSNSAHFVHYVSGGSVIKAIGSGSFVGPAFYNTTTKNEFDVTGDAVFTGVA